MEKRVILLLTHMLISSAAAAGVGIAKPGCRDECGSVKIPFPFGIEDGCFYNNNTLYKINCDNSTGKLVPVLAQMADDKRPVLNIDFHDHTLRVSNQVAYACYQGGKLQENFTRLYYTLDVAPFANSPKNKLVGVGCDTTARVGDDDRTPAYFTGCMTSCLSASDVTDGLCSGMGCCGKSIPSGIYMPYVKVDSIDNHRSVEKFNPCSFAFVSEGGAFNFSLAVLNYSESEYAKIRVPALVDWAIFDQGNCTAQKQSGKQVLCGSKAECVDAFVVEQAYLCTCSKGYSGNPYLPHTCQDIDECSDGRANECEEGAKCVNNEGGYKCSCPSGFIGVGTRTSPCVRTPTDTTNHTSVFLGLSISLGSILALIFLAGLYKVLKRRKEIKQREHNFNKNGGLLLKQQLSAGESAVERTVRINLTLCSILSSLGVQSLALLSPPTSGLLRKSDVVYKGENAHY